MIGSLFSGIGGLELGLEWAGLGPTVWQVEQDEFCRRVLARHWPDADRSVTDVRAASATNLRHVNILCGGFPCQDVSSAGKQAGLDGARSGLWFEYLRIVTELRPRVVIVENVRSGARRYLCPVRDGLHELGYRTVALGIGACDVGAPHRRQRVFVVAYAIGQRELESEGSVGDERRRLSDSCADVSDAERKRQHLKQGRSGGPHRQGATVDPSDLRSAQSSLGRAAHGLPHRVDRFPAGPGRQEAWEPPRTSADVTERPAKLKALGNAVVPQCALEVGRWIVENLGDAA